MEAIADRRQGRRPLARDRNAGREAVKCRARHPMSSMQTAKKGLWAEIRQPVTALKADFRQLLQISWHPDPEIRSQGLSH